MANVKWLVRMSGHYYWLSSYLQVRGVSGQVRAMMALIAASLALCLLALTLSVDGPEGVVPEVMTWVAVAGGVAGAMLWAWRWPTRAQSVTFAVVTVWSIALACLAYPDPLAALMGCIAFSTIGAYIAFLHTTPLVIFNFVVAAGVAGFQAVRLASSGHLALAAVDLFLLVQINIALPLTIYTLVRALGGDLLWADRDPLTGLCNRRAFQYKTLTLIADRRGPDAYLTVMVIDLDSFKAVNDSLGHVAGDRALVQVARVLGANTRDTAVIARSGGEEFLIADTSSTHDLTAVAQRICDAIAASPAMVTASVGTSCIRLDELNDGSHRPLMDHLVTTADAAMYRAKRSGGNRFHHHGLCDRPLDLPERKVS